MQALGGRGYLDFYISDPYFVGLEITRESSALNEHLGRFMNTSKYKPMLDSGAIQDHAVVDFRSPPQAGVPVRPRLEDQFLYTVQFLPGFTEARIWHRGASHEVHVHGRGSSDYLSALSMVPGIGQVVV